MKILVCDDKEPQYRLTRRAIGLRAEVTPLVGVKLKRALTDLFKGVAGLLNGASDVGEGSHNEIFEGFDLVIVDNNLTGLDLEGARLTAETIIGYLRAFTDVSYIVSLNKNPHVDFDLRYLFGDYQSLADLALNTRHLSNPRLWERNTGVSFAPWYWPRLADAANRRREQIDLLVDEVDSSVWEALGFPGEADQYLSFRAKAALSSGDRAMRDVTFEAFFDSTRALAPAEVRTLRQLAKTENEGGDLARRAIRHIVAYEVDRWLRRDVLGPQDVLIDLPHLLAQMPFLLGERASELESWNRVVAEVEPPFVVDTALFETYLKPARFGPLMWAPTPCFWWPTLKADDGLSDRFFEAEDDWPDAVFCEDVSRFVPVSGGGGSGSPQEFEAEVAGSWPRRFVLEVDGYQYSPRSRIVGSAA